MDLEIKKLNQKFILIKNMSWIKSIRKGWGGIGITFEYLLGNNENDFEIPDYNGIEIKTRRAYSKSNITLFSCAPEGPHYHEIERLKDLYGYPDSVCRNFKVLNAIVSANKITKVGLFFYFQLKIDRAAKKIFLLVYNSKKILIEDIVYWDFDTIYTKVYRKLKYMALAKALVKRKNKEEYFKYYKLTIYKLKDFDNFLTALEKGKISISFKISVYRDGKYKGKIYDHGTSFNLSEENLLEIFEKI